MNIKEALSRSGGVWYKRAAAVAGSSNRL
jgi:hypothetical protein